MFNSGFTNKTAYKVIRPYTSQKIHFSLTLEGGASKCYREVKSLMPNSNDFSVMNMTTNELYDYKLNKLPAQQNGGIMPSLDMKKLEEKIESLEKRVKTLEDKNISVNTVNEKIEIPDRLNNLFESSEKKIIQPGPSSLVNGGSNIIQPGPSSLVNGGSNIIQPGPSHINSDFAKAFL